MLNIYFEIMTLIIMDYLIRITYENKAFYNKVLSMIPGSIYHPEGSLILSDQLFSK